MEILAILAWLGCAIGAGAIASSKGRSGIGFFILGLVLPFIVLLIAIGMSDARNQDPLGRAVRGNDLVMCHSCKKPRRADAVVCPHCRAGLPDPHANEKKCPACAEWVLKDARKCKHCGEPV